MAFSALSDGERLPNFLQSIFHSKIKIMITVDAGGCCVRSMQVGRREWDNGEHECPVRRREDVLVKHASGAGKLRNRQ